MHLSFRLSSLVLLLAPVAVAQEPESVLVILADDLGVDHVGAYGEGAAPAPTPNIDALAAGGVLFRNALAYPSCSPTRAAVLTGRHPVRTLVGRWIKHAQNDNPAIGTLRRSEFTLPEVIDLAGGAHVHAAIGKWHVHDATFPFSVPVDVGGFGTYTGFLAGQLPDYWTWPRVENGVETTVSAYATTQHTDDAIAWIQAQTEPWVCYLAYFAPHKPFHDPPAALHPQTPSPTTDLARYRAMIEALDTEIGRLLAALPAPGSTHVLFLGDNGSVQNMAVPPFDPGRAKGTPYEGGLNVPLIYAGPATVSPGREVGALACAVDVFPTVLELAGAAGALPPWTATDGVSFAPYLANPGQAPLRTHVYSEEFTGDVWPAPLGNGHAAARDARYKLIDRVSGTDEMFDLGADPFENVNLLAGTLSTAEWIAYLQLAGVISARRAPLARVVPFGPPGCAGGGGVPTLGSTGLPALGSSFAVTLTGASPTATALLALGTRHDAWLGLPLPFDLGTVGAGGGCWLSFAPITALPAPVDAGGNASVSWAVPTDPALVESTILAGWLVLEAPSPGNPLGLVTSGAAAIVVGT